jgi:hypothetical protein
MLGPPYRTVTSGLTRAATALICCALLTSLIGCEGRDSAPAGDRPPAADASAAARGSEVVITGAISRKYTPQVTAVQVADNVGISLNESEVCG